MSVLRVCLLLLSALAPGVVRAHGLRQVGCLLNYHQQTYRSVSDMWNSTFSEEVLILGKGSSGQVSLARLIDSEDTIAVKTFSTNFALDHHYQHTCTVSTQTVRHVQLEYHIGQQLNSVRGVAKTLDLIHDIASCKWHLLLEYIPQSLAGLRKKLSNAEKVQILKQISSTLQEIHQRGMVHGDVKLENILLTDTLDPKLIDFGSSTLSHCRIENPVDANGLVVCNVIPGDHGTVAYMPPEVFHQLEYDRTTADIWSLGVLALVLFNNKTPWKLAEESDPGWRSFMGWEKASPECRLVQQCCVTEFYHQRRSLFANQICPVSRAFLFDHVPRSIQADLASWLSISPIARSAF